ncbi:hypothetical protein M0805_003138 [Coniferiporia weirii]|nr:hypothetical protein M0805_003138 [Coniferiporia weirii]
MYFLDVEEGPKSGHPHDELKASADRKEVGFSGEADDMYNLFNPDIFRISPIPECAPLNGSRSSSDSEDEAAVEKKKLKQRSLAPPSPPSSLSGSVSRASDSAAALKLSPNMVAIPISAAPGRPRSDSSPFRISTRDASRSPKEQEREASSSVPKSYMYRDVPQVRSLFPPTPKPPQAASEMHERKTPEVMRLYSLLEKPVPTVDSRFEPGTDSMNSRGSGHEETPHPTLLRSSSFHQSHTSSQPAPSTSSSSPPAYFRPHGLRQAQTYVQAQPSLLSASQPCLNVQTQPQTQSQPQGQDQALSPVQRTPPRPVLPHLHSFSFYNPVKPASPQENRVRATGTLPRRGSLSSASAAAAAAHSQSHSQAQPGPRVREAKSGTSTSSVPAIVPPSSLWSGRPHAGGLYERQESD